MFSFAILFYFLQRYKIGSNDRVKAVSNQNFDGSVANLNLDFFKGKFAVGVCGNRGTYAAFLGYMMILVTMPKCLTT